MRISRAFSPTSSGCDISGRQSLSDFQIEWPRAKASTMGKHRAECLLPLRKPAFPAQQRIKPSSPPRRQVNRCI